MQKLVNIEELLNILAEARKNGRTVVFTNGCFDIIHPGHVRYLKTARKEGDLLVVGLNSDVSIKKIKGGARPIIDELSRAEVLAALESVSYIVLFDEETPEKLVALLKPDVFVKGGDYQRGQLPEAEIVESYGGRVVLAEEVKDWSTTGLIERILKTHGS